MKFLHVLTYNVWNSERTVNFIKNNFNSEEHEILLLNYPEELYSTLAEKVRGCVSTDALDKKTTSFVEDLFNKSDYIIWHGIFLSLKWLIWAKKYHAAEKKYVWISQGTDLYNWQAKSPKDLRGKLRVKLFNRTGWAFRKQINFFGAAFPSDKYYFAKSINPHGRVFDLSYLDGEWLSLISQALPEEPEVVEFQLPPEPQNEAEPPEPEQFRGDEQARDDEQVQNDEQTQDPDEAATLSYPDRELKFLVGLNESPLNCHIAILNSLVNIRYEKIRLYIPLVGGQNYNSVYVQKVKEHAELMFGEKAVCITELSSRQEYIDLMAQIDIVVTRAANPAACCHDIYDSILTAYALGKVVSLSEKSSLYRFFRSQNYSVLKAESIYRCPYSNFWERVAKGTGRAQSLQSLMDECADQGGWRRLFTALEMEQAPIKFLHIIRPSAELATPIVEIVHNNFDTSEHQFLMNRRIWIQRCEQFLKYPNVRLFLLGQTKLKRMKYMLDQMKRAENIVWHGFYVGYAKPIMDVKELLLISAFPKLLKKTAWVGWGTDLYDWRGNENTGSWFQRLKVRLFNHLAEKARKSIQIFISVFPPDGDYFRSQYGDGPKVLDGTYSNRNFRQLLEDNRPCVRSRNPDRPLNILVGHSANHWNYHMQILKELAKYRYENIRIFIPLSTGGNKQYIETVKSYAHTMFGKKAVCVMQKIPLHKYIKFLWAMDVAVFRLDRQAALGNLMNLLYMGKKVFLPGGTIMYDFFNSRDVKIWDTDEIDQLPFEEFARRDAQAEPPRYILERTDPQINVEKWRTIFEEIEKNNRE